MRTEAKIALTLIFAGGAMAGCSTPDVQATADQARVQGHTEAAGTIFAQTAATETPTATVTATPDFPTPSITPLSEPTPTPETLPGEDFITQYLGFKNSLVNETTGESKTSVEAFKDYFLSLGGRSTVFDRMYAQLTLPVKDFSDRATNFDWRSEGQGLGFTPADLQVLTTLDNLPQFRLGEDNYYRGLILTPGRTFDAAVLTTVDNWLKTRGYTDPVNDASVQALRRQTFERIVYVDLGVSAAADGDDQWQTVNDRFDIACSTYTALAEQRSQQSETTRPLHFDPDQEIIGDGQENEGVTELDSDTSVLVVGVVSPQGNLRVEVYTLSNSPDQLNDSQDKAEEAGVSASGYRWLPCGIAVATATPTLRPTNQPGVEVTSTPRPATATPKPPKETPMPTHTHNPPTATQGPPPTLEPTATDVP